MKLFKTVAINFAVFAVLYAAICVPFSMMNTTDVPGKNHTYDANTIRSTFPNYAAEDPAKRLQIFTGYIKPKSTYKAFVGYRRVPFESEFVNIDSNGYRVSLNHSLEPDYVFLGGSTTWGTGAADDETIPSHFAKLTSSTVLNLGESGFNSIQELNQLFYFLTGTSQKPKAVFFYDGVNDGYDFCQGDNLPTHSFETRFRDMIDTYPKLIEPNGASSGVESMSTARFFAIKFRNSSVFGFLKSPFTYAAKVSTEKSNPYDDKTLTTTTPFEKIVAKNSILNCERDDRAKKAAAITVRAWLNAYAQLERAGIRSVFVLQPAAQVHESRRLKLDHLLDAHKQLIADTTASYRNFYKHVLAAWNAQCGAYGACKNLLDASKSLGDLGEPVFIDDCHISSNGNLAVARGLKSFLDGKR